jgi:hypothetical protein
MNVIEHMPICPVCKVGHIPEADGRPCSENPAHGCVSWEATADAYAEQLRGAVARVAELETELAQVKREREEAGRSAELWMAEAKSLLPRRGQ